MTLTRVGSGLLAISVAAALLGGTACVSESDGDSKETGGTGGVGGATGSGGAAGKSNTGMGGAVSNTGEPGAVACGKAEALISDFTYVEGTSKADQVTFGDFVNTFSGGTYVYPNGTAMYPLTSDVTKSNWHITGTVGDYSGVGLFFNNCSKVDASAFSGISFTISGTLPSGMSTMHLTVGTAGNDIPSAWLHANVSGNTDPPNFGRCTPATSNKYDGSCNPPGADFSVTSTPTTLTFKWADLKGGKPEPSVNPAEITLIAMSFTAPAGVGTASVVTYPVDITIDDLKFVP
ncbi:MAG: hypothetical protein ACOY0T_04105 [Myxococcota bacterium]